MKPTHVLFIIFKILKIFEIFLNIFLLKFKLTEGIFFCFLNLNFHVTRLKRGNSYMKLEEWLYSLRILIFAYCIVNFDICQQKTTVSNKIYLKYFIA